MDFRNFIDIPSDDDDEPQNLDVTRIRPYINAVVEEEEDDIVGIDGDSGR